MSMSVLVIAINLLSLLKPVPPKETTVTRKAWIEAVRTALPTAFCKPDAYFRQCFDVTQETCEDTARSATRTCLADVQKDLPEVFKQPEDGQKWGSKVGACVGQAYELAHLSKRVHSEKCDDPSKWAP